MQQIRTQAGDTLQALMWGYLGRDDDETETLIYQLNPHLYLLPRILPAGIVLKMQAPAVRQVSKQVGVWS
ncbi:MAG: tail protein X [Plesiomonas shigelloides]